MHAGAGRGQKLRLGFATQADCTSPSFCLLVRLLLAEVAWRDGGEREREGGKPSSIVYIKTTRNSTNKNINELYIVY
jgi:hypothetical protein